MRSRRRPRPSTVVVLALMVCASCAGPSSSDDPAEADRQGFDSAIAICRRFAEMAGKSQSFMTTSPLTAGEITAISRRMSGRTLSPWDQLPEDAPVAQCGFSTVLDGGQPSATTVCADGVSQALDPGEGFLVAEDLAYTTSDEWEAALAGGRSFSPCE